ncbi:hypothetical protein [Candidatus Leptofilum sp.]|uniref:hypothetical protein n=1 Tax=Candidatus Leptofilum sp. TaxID=3241576 RepID=UPI003B5A6E42
MAIVAIIASAAIRLGNSRSRNELPVATAVPIVENTAVPQETPSTTPMPIPPTPEPDETDTAVPTDTPEPTNTPTNPPTPPDDNPPITVTHAEGVGTVYVLAGPGEENVKLGTLEVNEGGIIIGRTASSEWLKIVTDRGKEGWVANCEVVISEPNLDDVPISWSGRVTPKICSVSEDSGSGNGSGAGSTGCVQVSLIKTEVPGKPFDNVLLSWSNVPATTTQLHFWVTGPTNAGESAYVIHPTFSDTDVPYEVELYHFEDGGFEPDATYTYIVQPHNASSEVICTTQGTFVP